MADAVSSATAWEEADDGRFIVGKKELLIPDHGHNIRARPNRGGAEERRPCERPSHPRRSLTRSNASTRPTTRASESRRTWSITSPSTAGDELTETLKPRRRRILEKYATEIDAMYKRAALFAA
jgi:hypothetical protein